MAITFYIKFKCREGTNKDKIKKTDLFAPFLDHPRYRCPEDFPHLEIHEDMGDVCRKYDGENTMHKCPDGCSFLSQSPWCKDISSGEPCRVPRGNVSIS